MANQYPVRKLPQLTESIINRFWSKVAITAQEDKCWEWQGSKLRRGYGGLSITLSLNKDAPFGAHRISYYLENKVDALEKLVCHKCDNPGCVNPKHLFLGTEMDNMVDKINKGRTNPAIGKMVKSCKLSEEDAIKIRELYSEGVKQTKIAVMFNVHQ